MNETPVGREVTDADYGVDHGTLHTIRCSSYQVPKFLHLSGAQKMGKRLHYERVMRLLPP